tara:strand:- start:254 stop:523 length:270 start_codon:yes stop_codon:yes gene_type:complete
MRIASICLIIILNLNFNAFAKDEQYITDEELLKYSCSSCHSLNIIYQQRLNEERWKEIILLMYNENGMTKLDKKYEDRLIKYLSKNYNY